MFAQLKKVYAEVTEVEGYKDLQDADKEKVKSAWEEGNIPEDTKGPGEAAVLPKKAPAKRAKKDDGAPPKKRVRKAKVNIFWLPVQCRTKLRLFTEGRGRRRGRRGGGGKA